jgi:hypothetical protein
MTSQIQLQMIRAMKVQASRKTTLITLRRVTDNTKSFSVFRSISSRLAQSVTGITCITEVLGLTLGAEREVWMYVNINPDSTRGAHYTFYLKYIFVLTTHFFLGLLSDLFPRDQLTSWRKTLLENLTATQQVKKLPAFYGSRRFVNVFARARHWSLSWARWIQSKCWHTIPSRSILILSYNVRLGLPMVSYLKFFWL